MRKVAVSEVEVIRAVSLGDFPHGFLGRRGGVSVGDLAGLNVGYGSNDDREAIAENRRRADRRGAARRRAGHRPPGPFGGCRPCRPRLAAGRAAARRRHGHRPPEPAARHPHRRLRAGAVRRSPRRGWSARPTPAGAARSPGSPIRPSRRWSSSARGASISTPPSDRASRQPSYEVDEASARAS